MICQRGNSHETSNRKTYRWRLGQKLGPDVNEAPPILYIKKLSLKIPPFHQRSGDSLEKKLPHFFLFGHLSGPHNLIYNDRLGAHLEGGIFLCERVRVFTTRCGFKNMYTYCSSGESTWAVKPCWHTRTLSFSPYKYQESDKHILLHTIPCTIVLQCKPILTPAD